MAIHRQSIRAILFYGGATKKERAAEKRKLAKKNALPSAKEIKRIRSKKSKASTLLYIFQNKSKGLGY